MKYQYKCSRWGWWNIYIKVVHKAELKLVDLEINKGINDEYLWGKLDDIWVGKIVFLIFWIYVNNYIYYKLIFNLLYDKH